MKVLLAIFTALIITACGGNDSIYGVDFDRIDKDGKGEKILDKYSDGGNDGQMGLLACAFAPLMFMEQLAFGNVDLKDLDNMSPKDFRPIRLTLKGNVLTISNDDLNKIEKESFKKEIEKNFLYEKLDDIEFLTFKEKSATCRMPLKKLN